MGKRIRDYVKYSLSELENYAQSSASCVQKVNAPIHLNFPPYGLANFRKTLQAIIAQRKIGVYDPPLKGIILDIRKIKVMSDLGALRFDDPSIHLNLRADCYVFQPAVGAIIRGLVKHISDRQIGVIIYRVFSVSIRLNGRVPKEIELNSEIEFRIKQFDLENVMPFIEGELVSEASGAVNQEESLSQDLNPNVKKRKLKFEVSENASSGYNSDHSPEAKPLKKTFKTDPDSDADSNYIEPSQRARSPDLFSELSTADYEEEHVQNEIKQEKLTQDAEMSDIEPFQRLKEEKLSHEISQALRSERNSDAESPTKRSKRNYGEDSVSYSQIKNEKISQDNCGLQNVEIVKQETDTGRRKKSSKKIKSEENMPDHGNDISHLNDISFGYPLDVPSCSKTSDSKVDTSTSSNSIKKEKRKRKKENTITEIHLDSDFEMTVTTPASKHRKKKKRSKEAPDSNFDTTNNSTFLDPNEVIDVENLSFAKNKKKKKKSKDKDKELSIDNLLKNKSEESS